MGRRRMAVPRRLVLALKGRRAHAALELSEEQLRPDSLRRSSTTSLHPRIRAPCKDMLGIFGVEVACEWARVLDDSNVGSLVLGEDLLQHGEGAEGIESDATPFDR